MIVFALALASGLALVEPAAATRDSVNIVSLGDSYTAGVGAGNYFSAEGVAKGRVTTTCWRSLDSYPGRVAEGLRDRGLTVGWWHEACTSAVLNDVNNQIGRVPRDKRLEADYVMLTMGGNDFGFFWVAALCLSGQFSSIVSDIFADVVPSFLDVRTCTNSLSSAGSRLDDVIQETSDYLRITASAFPNAKIILVGYPDLASPGCSLAPGYDEWLTALQDRLSDSQESLVGQLNRQQPNRYAFVDVRVPSRGPCGGVGKYVNFISVSPKEGSFHPNKEGHQAVADLILRDVVRDRPGPLVGPRASLPKQTWVVGETVRLTSSSGWNRGKVTVHTTPADTHASEM